MKSEKLSKLQIRSEIMIMLRQLSVYEEVPKIEQDKYLEKFCNIQNRDYVLEILLKEITRSDYKKGRLISFFLTELGTLEQLQNNLWAYIKNPKLNDTVKDLAGITLRNLGDNTDPELFLSYLNNPQEIIDKETQKLLETAIVNPEAQIDFLDFLFSLPENEQIDLIQSLSEDYSGDYLANILTTALESNPSEKIKAVLIETLGGTKSLIAVSPIIKLLKFSENEYVKKMAKKSLNMLKLSGVNIDNEIQDPRGRLACQMSTIYECYASIVDGTGSQGLIISRIKPDKDILMFSVIVNDTEGIIDCFGFNGISESDFAKIIDRFQEGSTNVHVTPEYCKWLLEKSEKINKIKNTFISYEYIAWKTMIQDIPGTEKSIEETALAWAKPEFIKDGDTLYKHPDFNYWFLEENDNSYIKDFIEKIISKTIENHDYFIKNPDEYRDFIEKETLILTSLVFDENLKEIYKKRLLNAAYLLGLQGLTNFKTIASSTAAGLGKDSNIPVEKSPFFIKLIQKTIIKGFLKYQRNNNRQDKFLKLNSWNNKKSKKTNSNLEQKLIKHDLNDIIEILYKIMEKI